MLVIPRRGMMCITVCKRSAAYGYSVCTAYTSPATSCHEARVSSYRHDGVRAGRSLSCGRIVIWSSVTLRYTYGYAHIVPAGQVI